MSDQLNPTITLAELYESQNQLLDALMVYQKLLHRNPSSELEEKISNLKKKIFADDEMQYNPVIEQIFSQDDRLQFNILPHSYYKKFKSSLIQPKLDSMDDIEEAEAEPIISAKYNKELDKVFKEFEQEHRDVLVSQSTKEQTEEEPAEIFTDEVSEQTENTEIAAENPDIESAEKEKVEEAPKIKQDDDFFDIPFEDLAQTFRKDQLKSEEFEKHKDAEIEEDKQEKIQPEKSQQEKQKSETEKEEIKAQETEDKIKQITKDKEPEPIIVEDKIEDEIEINTDLEEEPDELSVEKVVKILHSENTEPETKEEPNLKKTDLSHQDSDSLSDLDFEPIEEKATEQPETEEEISLQSEIDDTQEEPASEMKYPKQENVEGLSFEELVAKLDEEQGEDVEKKSEPSQPEQKSEEKTEKKAAELISQTKEEISDRTSNVKEEVPFEYTEDDISLKELEAELKAEFQKTKKQAFQEVKEKTAASEDTSQPIIKPILDDKEETAEKTEEPNSQITPEVLEKIIASNKSEEREENIKPILSEEDVDENVIADDLKTVEKEQKENKIEQKTESTQLGDLEFGSEIETETDSKETGETKSTSLDLDDLSFDMTEKTSEEEDKKTTPQESDLEDLDKPFEEIAAETEKKPEEMKESETSKLEKDFTEIESENESAKKISQPESKKRFSEYVPEANQPEDEFFSNSFDDIIKQSNELIRQKNVGFQADDVIKKEKKDKNDKEKKTE